MEAKQNPVQLPSFIVREKSIEIEDTTEYCLKNVLRIMNNPWRFSAPMVMLLASCSLTHSPSMTLLILAKGILRIFRIIRE